MMQMTAESGDGSTDRDFVKSNTRISTILSSSANTSRPSKILINLRPLYVCSFTSVDERKRGAGRRPSGRFKYRGALGRHQKAEGDGAKARPQNSKARGAARREGRLKSRST